MSSPSTDAGRRTVVITGGAGGIGLAAARRFAAAGDRVAVLDKDAGGAVRIAAELGGRHFGIGCDVAHEEEVVAALGIVLERFGRIDVLVNNAGVVDPEARPILEAPLEMFRSIFAINLEGAYVAAREAGRAMLAAGGGIIVNVASLAGVIAVPNRAAYSASKAAMLGLTRTLACEWAGRGVRVNAVLPGYVATEIVASLRRGGKVSMEQVERRIPLGRLAEPDEIAAVIEHLASPDASFTTGASIVADGGYQAFGGTGDASAGGCSHGFLASSGRSVVVTGGAHGIGAATARRFAARGDRVCVLDRDPRGVALAEELGPEHHAIAVDVTDEDAVGAAVAAVIARFGSIDVLVNNAGVADAFRPTVDQTLADFRRVVDINLTGALVMARAVSPGMIARGAGAIVNVASIAASLGLPGRNSYCASKAGLVMLTRSLACEWAPHGIRVNAVAPGYVATPGVAALESKGLRDLDDVRRRTAMGRLAGPGEIAAVIDFLASPEASYMTGASYAADGGWSAYGDAGAAWTPASPDPVNI